MMNAHYDTLEIRPPAQRERELMEQLPAQVARAKSSTAHFGRLLAAIDPADIRSRAALAGLSAA